MTLDHVVGFATDVSQLRRLPLATLEAAIVMADIDQNAVQSTSGAELQLADSETITSTLLLADMHERCRAKGKAESPLVIVPQFLDVLTTRVFKRHPGLLEEESDANAMVGEDSSDDDAAAPGSAFGVGRTLCVHRNFLETAALTSSALSIYGAMALRALLGIGRSPGSTRRRAAPAARRALRRVPRTAVDPPPSLRRPQRRRGGDALSRVVPVNRGRVLCGNQPVCRVLRHRQQASRRWRGGRRDDSARTRRKILISTQVGWCRRNRESHGPTTATRK